MSRKNRSNPKDITDIYVRSESKKMIKLANLINTKETTAPRELNHFNQLRAVKMTASLAPGVSIGEALNFLQAKAKEILPGNMQVDYDGESREFRESSSSLAATFVLALVFIYLVLSAQFESFVNPFIIILTVPLSMAGALLMLYFFGGTLNIYSKIGLITLIGLITKHGILIVEFAGHLRLEGKSIDDAIRESALLRLRPILMTTGAMILSAVPLALARGAGAESRHQIGLVIIGGMMVGTFFTLFVVPVVYSLIYRKEKVRDLL
jgi:multidrug efflux pump